LAARAGALGPRVVASGDVVVVPCVGVAALGAEIGSRLAHDGGASGDIVADGGGACTSADTCRRSAAVVGARRQSVCCI
jgi:hypothetical protein